METRKLVEYLGYFITLVAVGCGFSLAYFPLLATDIQTLIHAALSIVGILLIIVGLKG